MGLSGYMKSNSSFVLDSMYTFFILKNQPEEIGWPVPFYEIGKKILIFCRRRLKIKGMSFSNLRVPFLIDPGNGPLKIDPGYNFAELGLYEN